MLPPNARSPHQAYTKPWSFPLQLELQADADMIEDVCDNERDSSHSVAKLRSRLSLVRQLPWLASQRAAGVAAPAPDAVLPSGYACGREADPPAISARPVCGH